MAKKPVSKNKKAKVTASKKTAVSKKTVRKPVDQLGMLHRATVVLHLAGAVAAGLLMAPTIYSLSLSYATKDALLSQSETVFTPAERVMFDIDIRWLFVGLAVPGIIYSLLLLTRWRQSYDKAIGGRVYLWRWVYLAVVFAVMVKLASIVSGAEDLVTLKMAGGLAALGMVFAWLSERQNEKVSKPNRANFVLFVLASLLAWEPLIVSAIGSWVYGLVRLPWYVYALDGIVALGSILLMVNLYLSNKHSSRLKDYRKVERNYVVIALLTQVAFIGVAILGLQK